MAVKGKNDMNMSEEKSLPSFEKLRRLLNNNIAFKVFPESSKTL